MLRQSQAKFLICSSEDLLTIVRVKCAVIRFAEIFSFK